MRRSKYGAVRTEIDGITFDSKAEANYYWELKLLQRAGEIKSIVLQPAYLILDGYELRGKKNRPVYYKADFEVEYADGRKEVIDVKGMKTELYRLKKKMFESKYQIPVKEVDA